MRRLLAGLVCVLLLASCSAGSDDIQIEAMFEDVGDLVVGASVQSSDVRIGTVKNIELEGYKARVFMTIDPKADLRSDASAVIRSTSLLGEKFVQITSGGSREKMKHGDVVPTNRTNKVAALDDVLTTLGKILEGGSVSDLGVFIDSAAGIVRGKEEQLGQVVAELRNVTNTLGERAPEIGAAVDRIESTFTSLNDPVLSQAVSSSADATQILADQQDDLERLVQSLADFSEVAGKYAIATTPDNDASIKNIRLILDELMKTTVDLDRSLGSLASFTDLWPLAIPGDFLQLDVTLESGSSHGPASSSAAAETAPHSVAAPDLRSILWEAIR